MNLPVIDIPLANPTQDDFKGFPEVEGVETEDLAKIILWLIKHDKVSTEDVSQALRATWKKED
jgi:hypothetical protein